jgi:hypothetical protein
MEISPFMTEPTTPAAHADYEHDYDYEQEQEQEQEQESDVAGVSDPTRPIFSFPPRFPSCSCSAQRCS